MDCLNVELFRFESRIFAFSPAALRHRSRGSRYREEGIAGVFPDFLCIGAQKAGTTWLHHNLAQQPEIWLPPIKEVHFLDHAPPSLAKRVFGRRRFYALARANVKSTARGLLDGSSNFENFKAAWRFAYGKRDLDWYSSLFPSRPGLVCGEICPGYARLSPEVIRAITQRNPRLKIIYLLRDPIDRAWSSVAMHFRKQGRKTIITEALGDAEREQLLKRIANSTFQSHCRYDANISNWLTYLPENQIYFGFFERIEAAPAEYIADILRFLGVERAPTASAPKERINAGRGEVIDPVIERELGVRLMGEAARADARFGNAFTAQWLAHAKAAVGAA